MTVDPNAADSDRVELTDLDVIATYSLAVRTATASRSDLIAALRSDLAWLESNGRRPSAPAVAKRAAPAPAKKAATARRATPVKKSATARRTTAAKKTAARRGR